MDTRAIVESSSNYVKFGNGLLVQWGGGTGGYYNNPNTITFNKSYNNPPRVVAVANSTEEHFFNGVYTRNVTTTNFKAVTSFNGSKGSNLSFDFVAIGF